MAVTASKRNTYRIGGAKQICAERFGYETYINTRAVEPKTNNNNSVEGWQMTDTQALSVNTRRRPLGKPSPPVRVTDRRSFLTARRRPPGRQPLHPLPPPPAESDSFVRFCPAATPPPTTGFIIIFFFFLLAVCLVVLITALHTHARAHTRTQTSPLTRAPVARSDCEWIKVFRVFDIVCFASYCGTEDTRI